MYNLFCSSKRSGADSLYLRTLSASGNVEEWIFQAPNAIDICSLLQKFIGGLQKRSKYLLVIGVSAQIDIPESSDLNFGKTLKKILNLHILEDNIYIDCQMGDLLILAPGLTGSDSLLGLKICVENTRTGMHGMVATKNVYVLPTLLKPDVDLMVNKFRNYNKKNL